MDLFFTQRFYFGGGLCVIWFLAAFFFENIYPVAIAAIAILGMLCLADFVNLFLLSPAPLLQRNVGYRLSNGDPNKVIIAITNQMNFAISAQLIDELPEQFQVRNFELYKKIAAGEHLEIEYLLTPTERGLYGFGNTRIYVSSPLGLVKRRFIFENHCDVLVYPSYQQLHNVHLLFRAGEHYGQNQVRMRKLGQSMDFEQIKEYVRGDDVRTVNWKATARRGGGLMVNTYSEEKSQQVYCIIDKGRLMKMPFEGLSLLDYAINSTLVLSHVCLQRQDKIGLISFAEKIGTFLPAIRKPIQRENILNALYKQQTAFLEPDFEMLFMQLRNRIRQRSMLILFTNFETLQGARRQIPYLRMIARYHLLLVVFFENTELKLVAHSKAESVEDIYVQTIAGKFLFEKRLIVKELSSHGILSVLTPPQNLTISTVNKYLELKSRQAV